MKTSLPQHRNPRNFNNPNSNRRSTAAYNFVPLPEAVLPAGPERNWEKHDRYVPGSYTGWLELTITAETPLYVRCSPDVEDVAKEDPQLEGKHADLTRRYRHRQHHTHRGNPEEPHLDGSSILGAIRPLFEALTYSKFQWFSDEAMVYRAVGDPTSLGQHYREQFLGAGTEKSNKQLCFDYPGARLKAGYLKIKGRNWSIQPACEHNGESFVHVECDLIRGKKDGDELWIKPPSRVASSSRGPERNLALRLACVSDKGSLAYETKSGFKRATLVRTGGFPRKTNKRERNGRKVSITTGKHMECAVYEAKAGVTPIEIPRPLRQAYEEDWRGQRGIQPERRLTNGVPLENGSPVFYLVDPENKLVFFGHTMMFRVPYPHSISAFVPEAIRDRKVVDLADAVFGTVDGKAIAGRVFFEGGKATKRDGESPFFEEEGGYVVPKILATPKPTSFQHYLVQDDVTNSNGEKERGGDDKSTLRNYHHPFRRGEALFPFLNAAGKERAQGAGTVIRGQKRYWLRPGTGLDNVRDGEVQLQPNGNHPPRIQQWNERRNEWVESTQHTFIRPVKPKTVFTGARIRFENLTLVELGALLTAVKLEPFMRHQIGMGKPLGMGAVKIDCRTVLTERANREAESNRYRHLFSKDGTLWTGVVDAAEVEKDACGAFRRSVVELVGDRPAGEVPSPEEFWAIPRLAELAALLRFEELPDDWAARTAAMAMGEPWKQRRVLPTASAVLSDPAPPGIQGAGAHGGGRGNSGNPGANRQGSRNKRRNRGGRRDP